MNNISLALEIRNARTAARNLARTLKKLDEHYAELPVTSQPTKIIDIRSMRSNLSSIEYKLNNLD